MLKKETIVTTGTIAMIIMMIVALIVLVVDCTQQERAKHFGGSADINLPVGKKLVLVTWKDSDLWYLVRDMNSNDVAESYVFQESSSFGIMEGKINIRERK